MKWLLTRVRIISASVAIMVGSASVYAQIVKNEAQKSPWGPADEIGTLNMMTDATRLEVLKQVAGGKVYDLGVDLFVGMPNCCGSLGDQDFQMWMTHTPARGDAKEKELVAYSGDGISMYTHSGTHIDTLNHFGLHGKIWNHVSTDEGIGSRGWTKSGADKYPPIIAHGVLIDLAKSKNITRLSPSYAITVNDLKESLKKQGTMLRPGDVVLIRTGLMTLWPEQARYRIEGQPGLSIEAANWLVDEQKAMLLGADNFGVESFPSKTPDNFVPLHTFLLAEKGVSIIEVLWLEDMAKDQVYEFLFIASPLKLRGATASPIRPLAIPIKLK